MVFSSLVCFISLNWLTLTFNYIGHSSYQPLFEEIAPPFLQQLLRLLNISGYNAVLYIYDNPSKRGQGRENQLEFERTCSFALVF